MAYTQKISDELIEWIIMNIALKPKLYGATGGTYHLQVKFIVEIGENPPTAKNLQTCKDIERVRSSVLRVLQNFDNRKASPKVKVKYSREEELLESRIKKIASNMDIGLNKNKDNSHERVEPY